MLQYFQYKINHGYLSTNSYLNKIKRIDTNLCEHCSEIDELEHYFVSCKRTEGLWQLLSSFIIIIITLLTCQVCLAEGKPSTNRGHLIDN